MILLPFLKLYLLMAIVRMGSKQPEQEMSVEHFDLWSIVLGMGGACWLAT